MATSSQESNSFSLTLNAVEEWEVALDNIAVADARGLVAKITVTGGAVKFSSTKQSSGSGRGITDDTVYLTLFTNKFWCTPTNDTDVITVDI